jgi:hypothetical protein
MRCGFKRDGDVSVVVGLGLSRDDGIVMEVGGSILSVAPFCPICNHLCED